MSTQTLIANPNVAETTAQAAARPRLRLYLAILILLPGLFLVSSIAVVRLSSFPAASGDPFLLHPDFAYSQNHVDCDVVVFGDSTTETGVDPTVVQQATGLKTCNLAESQSIFEIVRPNPLDVYLEHNKPPRYIVLQFAPGTFARDHLQYFWPEGLTILMRRPRLGPVLQTVLGHPVETYDFAMWALKAEVAARLHGPRDFSTTETIFRSHQGLVQLPKPAEEHCQAAAPAWPPDKAWIEKLRATYAAHGTEVLVNVSPLPSCSPHADQMVQEMAGATDNGLALYPIGLYCDLDRHFTLEGARRVSSALANQIRQREEARAATH